MAPVKQNTREDTKGGNTGRGPAQKPPFIVPEKYRFSIELPSALGIKLDALCAEHQATKTEVVRKSLALLFRLHEKQKEGYEMSIERKLGRGRVTQFELDLGT